MAQIEALIGQSPALSAVTGEVSAILRTKISKKALGSAEDHAKEAIKAEAAKRRHPQAAGSQATTSTTRAATATSTWRKMGACATSARATTASQHSAQSAWRGLRTLVWSGCPRARARVRAHWLGSSGKARCAGILRSQAGRPQARAQELTPCGARHTSCERSEPRHGFASVCFRGVTPAASRDVQHSQAT